ncbi:cell division protein FtsL [Microbulbifer rhizosphaerae]|uniref:Cell division protein FtsL n=1 Tax=Microbulbifer rhizosphaerae TaxID=1562603 RepID=A0A7W4W836_9GAMM|nr:cell division protein FtsL [Microbulbifer rhizosphaerae]
MSGKRILVVTALWLAAITSSLAVVYSTHRSRALTAELVEAQHTRDELRYEQERLLLERGAWSAYNRIEQVAREKLDMHVPAPEERVLIRKTED